MTTFKDFSLDVALVNNLTQLGYLQPTEIQEASIPILLQHQDLIAQAKTGSGKTLAFLLPLLNRLDDKLSQPQALIITPTRELCEQVTQEAIKLARFKPNTKIVPLYGGTSLTKQVNSLKQGAHIIIGTPGRLLDHLSRDTLALDDVKTLILDEADRMLDMGFANEILKIVKELPQQRHSILFSATYPENISKLANEVLTQPKTLHIQNSIDNLSIKELGYSYEGASKEILLISILQHYKPSLAIVFCNTKKETQELSEKLYQKGFDTASLHGDLEQYERKEMLLQFANGSLPILIATDLASRGLDIDNVDLVINYSIPIKHEIYTHRIGRTGRAEKSGTAITLYEKKEQQKLNEIIPILQLEPISQLKPDNNFLLQGKVATLCIDGGKKKKIRAGDILGTLCKDIGLQKDHIGKIDIYPNHAYVAIDKSVIKQAFHGLKNGKIKGKRLRVWWLD